MRLESVKNIATAFDHTLSAITMFIICENIENYYYLLHVNATNIIDTYINSQKKERISI